MNIEQITELKEMEAAASKPMPDHYPNMEPRHVIAALRSERALNKMKEINTFEDALRNNAKALLDLAEEAIASRGEIAKLQRHIDQMSCCCAGCTKHNAILEEKSKERKMFIDGHNAALSDEELKNWPG